MPWLRLRGDLCNALGDLLPCGGGLARCERLACKRLRDHCVDLGGVKGAIRMIDHRLREGEQDRLVLLDECQSLLIGVLDEGRAARVAAADNPGDGIRAVNIALYEPGGLSPRIAISAAPRSPLLNICAKEFLMGGTTLWVRHQRLHRRLHRHGGLAFSSNR